MGQCLGSLWPNRYRPAPSPRSKHYVNGTEFNPEDEHIYHEGVPNNQESEQIGCISKATVTKSLSGMFSFTKRSQKNAYLLENTDEPHIEMYDMVTDPRFLRGTHLEGQSVPPFTTNTTREKIRETTRSSNRQPDLRQVVGLRNTLTCCVMQKSHYGKLKNEYSNEEGGGAAYIVLNPRNLNTTLSASKDPWQNRSKWSINSVASDSEKCHPPSIDLEWETDDALVAAAASHDTLNKNEQGFKSSCDPDTCSISTTVACTKGSRASSHISIPGLDWDSQVDNDDLVSLNNVETDFETEQLISEIELLTSRALQETQQWSHQQGQGSPSKTTLVEANNNPTNNTWTMAN